MKNKASKYRKFRRSKYKFRSKIIKGSGKTRGACIPGYTAALADIERELGRKVEVAKTAHRLGEWVFCELK